MSAPGPKKSSGDMLIAQMSDCHLRTPGSLALGRFDTHGALLRAVEHLNAIRPRPDVVLITGDVAYDGRPVEYEAANTLLRRLEMPWFPIPGNHDDRANMCAGLDPLKGLTKASDPPYVSYAIDDYPVRLIGLDATVPASSNELKDLQHSDIPGYEERVVEFVNRHDLASRAIINDRSPEFAQRLKHKDSTIRIALDAPHLRWAEADVDVILAEARSQHADILQYDHRFLTLAILEGLHEIGVPVWAWTAHAGADLKRLVAWGVDGILTDELETLNGILHGIGEI